MYWSNAYLIDGVELSAADEHENLVRQFASRKRAATQIITASNDMTS
ncbi:MAG TPA: hypothetical protein VGM50_06945 [Gemmatimonadaceae bacterium]